jgi:2-keto-4-pentenoate hydratase/2-oxohepta-3-ene-1,7-dioic acid hydratase in catechol pathway
MRLATIVEADRTLVACVRDGRYLPVDPAIDEPAAGSVRALARGGPAAVDRARAWMESRPAGEWRRLEDLRFGPAIRDPSAIFTIGLNYAGHGEIGHADQSRPLVYSKLPSSVVGHGAVVTWDRNLSWNVDAEVELGVVIGPGIDRGIDPDEAKAHVFGYTIINDVSSRDPWLDGDQWLLGKSMPGFCPVGPWIVTADELDPLDVKIGCTLNGTPIQDGRTSQMRHSIHEIVSYLSRHVRLRAGDLIATGTPARLTSPPGPDRHLEPGDVVTCWIEGIGELTNTIA